MRLGDLESRSFWCSRVRELQCQILAGELPQELASLHQRKDATRACSADSCFSWKTVSKPGLVFGKDVCTFVSANSGKGFNSIKTDMKMSVTDSIRVVVTI